MAKKHDGTLHYYIYAIYILFYRFRWDFLDIHKKTSFGSFEYLKEHGTLVPHVKPVFPPEDYPVWTSIATGIFNFTRLKTLYHHQYI